MPTATPAPGITLWNGWGVSENANFGYIYGYIHPAHVYIVTARVKSGLGSTVVSIPACHAGDRGSIPRQVVHLPRKLFRVPRKQPHLPRKLFRVPRKQPQQA